MEEEILSAALSGILSDFPRLIAPFFRLGVRNVRFERFALQPVAANPLEVAPSACPRKRFQDIRERCPLCECLRFFVDGLCRGQNGAL